MRFAKYKLLIILILLLAMPVIIGNYIPTELKSFFYALSLTIKDILVLVLPFVIFTFLFKSLSSLKDKALLFIILLISMVVTSNFTAILIGYFSGSSFLPQLNLNLGVHYIAPKLQPLWSISLPKIISNELSIIFGVIFGIYFALRPNSKVEIIAKEMNRLAIYFLQKIFLPILPLFILGFVLKLEHEDVLSKIFNVYGSVLVLIITTQLIYTCFIYFLASGLRPKKMLAYLKNILPATITGFSTLSSAATMPVTIVCSERNLHNPSFAQMIIPATANIHTLGSAIGLTILAMATLITFGLPLPGIIEFITFAFFFTMAKFAVAGIPGGAIIIVSPLLEAHLGFNHDMIGLITAVYLLFDPFGTATNVTCNGGFAILFNKIYNSLSFITKPQHTMKSVYD